MPKRILIFSLTYLPFIGGAEIALKEITDRIDPQEYEFDLITLRFDNLLPKSEKLGKVSVHRVGFASTSPSMEETYKFPLMFNKYLFPFLAWYTATKLHRKKPFDAIWSMTANYAGFAAEFFKFFHPRMPFLLTLQDGDPIEHYKRRVGLLYPLYKKIFTKADIVQTISNYLANFAKQMGHQKDAIVIPNGVEQKLFGQQYLSDELAPLRKQLHLADKDRIVITVSRLVRKNAVDDCIRSMVHLPDDIKLIIVGEGPDLSDLQTLAAELNVTERIIFVGHKEHEEIPKFLKIADVFVRPSRSEGMGNVFLEAMAAGVPVIATQVGGIVDFLHDPDMEPDTKSTGLFCTVDDPKSIARQVKRLLNDETLRNRLCSNAEELVSREYGWDGIAKRMKTEFFAKLL